MGDEYVPLTDAAIAAIHARLEQARRGSLVDASVNEQEVAAAGIAALLDARHHRALAARQAAQLAIAREALEANARSFATDVLAAMEAVPI
jgi:hypothetical protein